MHDHYIACVLIIFAALLATIPTYHEMLSPNHCNNWSSTTGAHQAQSLGLPTFTDASWTNSAPSGAVPCNFAARLYCFQQFWGTSLHLADRSDRWLH